MAEKLKKGSVVDPWSINTPIYIEKSLTNVMNLMQTRLVRFSTAKRTQNQLAASLKYPSNDLLTKSSALFIVK